MKKKYLITTADETTWIFDQPVIFLGEWCRLYNRKHIWEAMDAVVAKPYGLGSLKKDTDYLIAKNLEKKLFPELCILLNNYHKAQHSQRFWSIVIGHWFRATIQMLLNRVNTIEQCFQIEDIKETLVHKSDYCCLASPDWTSALNLFNDDQWNNILYGRIISSLKHIKININYCEKNFGIFTYKKFKNINSNQNQSYKIKILRFSEKIYRKITNKFIKNDDAFIITSYLGKLDEIKLEIALGQFPQIWNRISPKIETLPNKKDRKNLTKMFTSKSKNYLENIVRQLIFELLPVYYLEAHKDLKKIIASLPWPNSPKFIFTSSNFYTDEIFKLWTATKVETGTNYYVGQHGNNYFTKKNLFPRIEEKTSDKFITWGWKNNLPKYVPAFIFKSSSRKNLRYNINGGLLLIETTQSLRLNTWDSNFEHNKYFNDQKKFVNHLFNEPRKKLTIRLGPLFKKRKYYEDYRWHDFNYKIKVDYGKVSLKKLIFKSRLVVHSYDSTGILETLSQNIPTLAFWQNDFDHLRNEVKPYYQLLVDVGILHLSSNSAADKVNEIWNDIDQWWKQKKIQKARISFCNIFAKNCDKPVQKMISIFNM